MSRIMIEVHVLKYFENFLGKDTPSEIRFFVKIWMGRVPDGLGPK